MKKILFFLLSIILFASCEDKIDITLDEGTSQLAVDAFLNNKHETQTIRLTKTSGYFDNSSSPPALGATIKLTNVNKAKDYYFIDISSSGNYIWIPGTIDTIGKIGDEFKLSITYGGEQFTASSIMNPAPAVDSISYVFRDANPAAGQDSAGYFASFWGTDFAGQTDFYWIKSFRNGVFNNNPSEINIAWDAAFGPGADGFPFILPIRDFITSTNHPFHLNDSVTVEIHAINEETWNFLAEVRTQTTNGGLFATPPANVRTNVTNVDPNSKIKPVGFFNIGEVTVLGKKIK